MCERFHCTPSQLDQEDAQIIRLVAIAARGTRQDAEEEVED